MEISKPQPKGPLVRVVLRGVNADGGKDKSRSFTVRNTSVDLLFDRLINLLDALEKLDATQAADPYE